MPFNNPCKMNENYSQLGKRLGKVLFGKWLGMGIIAVPYISWVKQKRNMINLFIDTNIFLNFYHFSNEDLESLKNLGKLIDAKLVRIHLPDQVYFEFKRNRESKIQDALKRLRANDAKAEIPQMCVDFNESKELKKAAALFKEK